jgi:hypothetical protein
MEEFMSSRNANFSSKFLGCFASFILLLGFSQETWAIDLWNGFTTDMSKTQVEARVKLVLKAVAFRDLTPRGMYGISRIEIYHHYESSLNNILPRPQEVLGVKSSLEQYNQNYLYNGSNIIFYFYGGKLYAVYIYWAISGQDLYSKAKQQYGNEMDVRESSEPTEYIGGTIFYGFTDKIYRWELNDRYVYVSQRISPRDDSESRMVIVGLDAIKEYPEWKAAVDQETRNQAEAERQRLNDKVTF